MSTGICGRWIQLHWYGEVMIVWDWRVNFYFGIKLACECNGHSKECDIQSCGACSGNTQGTNCESCQTGYYRLSTNLTDNCLLSPTPTSSQAPSTASSLLPVILGVVLGVLALAALILVIYFVTRRKQQKKNLLDESDSVEIGAISLGTGRTVTRRTESTLDTTVLNTKSEIALPGYLVIDPTTQLRVERHLTKGGGGAIYTATLTDPNLKAENGGMDEVVVKEITEMSQLSAEDNLSLFKQEVAAMSALRFHNNVVKLIGFCENPKIIVTPLYSGDLYDYLHATGSFVHLSENHKIPLDFQWFLISQMVDALVGKMFPCCLFFLSFLLLTRFIAYI